MIFGAIPTAECVGAILAHSLKLPKTVLKKGRVLSAADADALAAAGLRSVIAARLEPGWGAWGFWSAAPAVPLRFLCAASR